MRPPEPSRPFAVVCHDAGGAGQIAAILLRWGWHPAWVQARGPALEIFHRDMPCVPVRSEISDLHGIRAIITGTGWASDFEHKARLEARKTGVRSIAVLDHWTNYEDRFIRNGERLLPDELWVVDEYAEGLAQQLFPGIQVVRVPDSYAERELRHITPLSASTPNRVLYLLEPVRSNWGRKEPGEFQALRYFLAKWPFLKFPAPTAVQLRPHPSEDSEKYAGFLDKNGQPPVFWSKSTLSEDISEARWVAGCQSYAMTLALATGRPVYSTLPPWAPPKVLPHPGIQYLREMAFA
ncbi:MAG: hypothetical protein EB101_08595 [Chitinophagia bacterium]|nr:hypothetical protein [Chitinophagia bacterium]